MNCAICKRPSTQYLCDICETRVAPTRKHRSEKESKRLKYIRMKSNRPTKYKELVDKARFRKIRIKFFRKYGVHIQCTWKDIVEMRTHSHECHQCHRATTQLAPHIHYATGHLLGMVCTACAQINATLFNDHALLFKRVMSTKLPKVKLIKERKVQKRYVPTPEQKAKNQLKDFDMVRNEENVARYIAISQRDNQCEICLSASSTVWCVDHDHEKKYLRGKLCIRCNFLIGHMRDQLEHCYAAIQYLQKRYMMPKEIPILGKDVSLCGLTNKMGHNYFHKYKINNQQVAWIFEQQHQSCAICQEQYAQASQLQIDHDHITGEIRGMLCHNCNKGLGQAQNNVKIFEATIEYLCRYDH